LIRRAEPHHEVACPPDKSITHRLLVLAGMACGKSSILSPLVSGDTRATIRCLEKLGVRFDLQGDRLEVESPGVARWNRDPGILDCGNSGTTARLLIGVLSSVPGMKATIAGDESLSRRPMRRVLQALPADAGVRIESPSGDTGADRLPLVIYGAKLSPFHATSKVGSAQVKSALTLAGLGCDGETTITLPAGSRNHTEILCVRLGLPVSAERYGALETITVRGPGEVQPFALRVPGDPSSAMFLAAAGLLAGVRCMIPGICANPLRTAALDVLEQASIQIQRTPVRADDLSEPAENWIVPAWLDGSKPLTRSRAWGAEEIPAAWVPAIIDEVPVLATILAFAQGPSMFRGLGELRVKESDRLAGIVRLLNAAGCAALAEGDDLIIPGGLKAKAIPDFSFDPEGDHRLAMCAMVLEQVAQKTCNISDRGCVEVSFPDFERVLLSIASKSGKK
jgi:3-phosphoshikimate 1-carboxyvinyltransferase